MLLAVDPGAGRSKTIGVALFDIATGQLKDMQMFTFTEFDNFLQSLPDGVVTQVVYEVYQIRREKLRAHVGSRVEVVQSIGVLRAWCIRNNIPYDEQFSRILPIAEVWFQIKMPSNHDESHHISAMLHGMYWLKIKGIIKTKLEIETAKKEGKTT